MIAVGYYRTSALASALLVAAVSTLFAIGSAAAANISSTASGGNWSATATWVGGVLPGANDNVTIADGATVTINTSPTISSLKVGTGAGSATVLVYDSSAARTVTVGTFVTIASNGTFQGPSGNENGHVLSVGTDLINNGVLDFYINGNRNVGIIFTGSTDASFTLNAGSTTNLRQTTGITLNKGTSSTPVLTFTPGGTFTVQGANTVGFLSITNGTFKISGTGTFSNPVFNATAYTIPATGGFRLDNPNYTVVGLNGSPTNNGLLRISQGTFNVGTSSGNAMGAGAGAIFNVEGGTVNFAGRLNTANAVTYTQSAGTINVTTVGNSTNSAPSFGLSSGTSVFNMSGGTINLVRANTAGTPIDYEVTGTANITGGILNIGTAATPANSNFRISGQAPNIIVNNTTNNKTATLIAQTNVWGDTTISTGATVVLNGFTLQQIGATFTNNGTLNGTAANSALSFSGSAAQTYTGTGTTTAPLASFELDNALGLTLSSTNNVIAARVILFTGSVTNANKITLGNGGSTTGTVQIGNTTTPTAAGSFDVPLTFNLGSGGEVISYLRTTSSRSTGGEVNPTRSLATFTYDDNDATHNLTVSGGDLTVTGTTTLTNGRVVTGANNFIIGSAGTVARTNGYVDGNLRKTYTASGSKTFEVGTANGYSPIAANVTAGTGAFTAKAVQGKQPNIPGANALSRYWTLAATGLTANLTFNYLAGDVVGTEANYKIVKFNGSFTQFTPTTLNTSTHVATLNGVSSFSDWTLAEAGALLSTNANLSNLTISAGTLTPAFASGTLSYTASVSNATTSITVTPTVADATATVKVNGTAVVSGNPSGPIALAVGSNVITTVVTAQDGTTTRTYTVTVTRAAAYTLTYTAGANGTISGTTPQTVESGGSGTAVTAVPNTGYHFVNWSDASTANPRTDTNVMANVNVTANFAINTYTLTYTAGPNGSISGTSPQTVNHGANGTPVAAVPNAGYHFVNWSDSSTANPRTDTNVTANVSVTANFAINTYTLTYTAGANGSITGTSPQTVNYGADGTPVTAVPNAGYHFVNWSDSSTANPRTDTNVTANVSVTANFAINTYTLTYTAGANGSITGTSPQTVNYGADGTPVTAVPNTGYHFVNWSDASTVNPRTDTNVTANITVTANFAINTYTLTYTPGANGTITGTSPQTVNHGADGTPVTAVPNAGYHFVNWSDGVLTAARTDTNVTADISVTANFAINTYTLTYTAGANGSITGTSPQTVSHGADGSEVTAVPNTGYHFVDWSDGVLTAARTDTNVTANVNVTANFAINTYTLTYTAGANGSISGTSPQTVNHGADGSEVTAVPNTGYHFVDWSDGVLTAARTETNVTANVSVTANFAINTYTLTYTAGANGSITGTSPQTVNHGADGSEVTAVPNVGYHFVDWSDGSTANPRTDTNVTANVNVTANFAINTYTLTYTAGANGTITGTSPQTVNYGANGMAVTAVPDTGYHFVAWSDALTDNPRTDTNVTANVSVTANFAINTYTLTYTAGANGTITGTSPQTVNYGADGSEVTAVPNTGYHFVDWSDGSTANPRIDANVTADISVTANFAINTYTLTYTAGANGTISGTSPQTVNHGANGSEVTAVPNTGYHFVDWSDGVLTAARTDTNVTANISVTANFAINTYTLTYTAGANGSISGTSPQTVNHGADGSEVTAVPNTGYHFVDWSDGVLTAARTDTNVTANISVTANFAINTYTLTYTPGANGSITGSASQTVNYGANGTAVTAVPNTGYHFVAWSDASTDNPRTDTNVTANISVTANFAINTYTLTYTAGANGSITGTSPQTVSHGADGSEVTAVPNVGYHFVDWSDASTSNPRTDTNVMASISVTANFANNTPTLGNYPPASVPLSGNTAVMPDAAPADTTSINVSTDSNFQGTFSNDSVTGIVLVTDAHPAGIYTVTVTAFGPGGTTTKTFTLTVADGIACGAGFTDGFTNAADVNTGFHPYSVAIGDFNGDGKQDLAVVNANSNTVSIRLGDGLGGFSGSTEVSVGSVPLSVAIGDFNGDGKQDLAVANSGSNTVSIRLGDGLGGFSDSTEVSVGSHPYSVAIGDFNGDGKQDLAVANVNSNSVSIRLGDGLGGFSSSTEVSVSSSPISVAIGDFNGDGKQDLAVANQTSNTVSIRLGDGSGGFSSSTEVSVSSSPFSVAIGDFNGDGKQDLAVANSGSNTVSIRLGDGLGGFSDSTEVSVGSHPYSVAIGDFNGDGKQDLAVANESSNTVSIRLGDGLGGFSSSTEVSVDSNPVSVAIGDFNGDGKQDLAVANYGSNTVSIPLGECLNIYTVVYDGNGNTSGTAPVDGNSPYTVNSTVTVLLPGTLTKTGYTFASWNTAANGTGTSYAPAATFSISADTTLYAQWTINTYTLTYTAGPNGSISGPTPQTVNYGADGSEVAAVPNTGYHFVDWSDASTANPRTDTNVTANVSVTANFAINTYTLTYTAGADGSITGSASQTVDYGADGTPVTAVPNTGYHFVNWSDASTANPRTDTNVTASVNVTANFAINTYTLTYTAGTNGTISGTSPQTVNYGADGSEVTAVPNTGYHFVDWSDGSTANPRTDTNVTANVSVIANFAINTYTLTYTAGANGSISGTSPQTVNYGGDGSEVTAVPNTGYHFVNWSDASTENPRTDTNVTTNVNVTANFAINTYTLTYTAGANGSISGTSPQTVNYGADGTPVTAVPNMGYHFVNWSDASTANPRTDTNVTTNVNVTANFAINTYTLTYTAGANGSISGTSPQTVNYGADGTPVTAVPNMGYHFVNWSDASTANPRTDTNVTANLSVTANFAINTYTLTYTAGANGSITGSSPQTVNYGGNGSEVTAVANTGYHFVDWSDGVVTPARTDTNVMANVNVTANFAINSYTLTYTAGANGTITGTSPQTVNYGGDGSEVTAVANTGYHFVDWSDGVLTAARTDTNVMANVNVTANFAINSYTLTYTAGANGTITGTSPQTVNYGGDGSEVTAVANTGYHFVDWSDGVLTAARTDTNVMANVNVTANFAAPVVTNTNDGGVNSLRQALLDAEDGDTITFNIPTSDSGYNAGVWTITLTTGELVVDKNVTVRGPGADVLTVRRAPNATAFRIFHVSSGSPAAHSDGAVISQGVTIQGMTITNGHAQGTFPSDAGGGIYNDHCVLTVNACAVTGNAADTAAGGIFNDGAGSSGSVIVTNSTLDNNTAQVGGGMYNYAPSGSASLTINNTTFSDNSADSGGGIVNSSGSEATTALTIANSTFSGNSSNGSGHSIYSIGAATLRVGNTILNAPYGGTDVHNENGTFISDGYNLSSHGGVTNFGSGTGSLTATGDQINTNPMLGPLKYNGGPTMTHAPLSNSPAVDRGKDIGGTGQDQRGSVRPVTYDGSIVPPAGGDRSDIGAVELPPGVIPTSAVSRQTHGAAGDFDINLPFSGPVGIECRSGGATGDYRVIITFATPVTYTSAAVTDGAGSVSSGSGSGTNQVTVNLTGVSNIQTITLALFGTDDGVNGGDVGLRMGVLIGDTSGNGGVNASDVSQVKAQSGQLVGATNFREDVTVSGTINASDVGLVKSKSGTALP